VAAAADTQVDTAPTTITPDLLPVLMVELEVVVVTLEDLLLLVYKMHPMPWALRRALVLLMLALLAVRTNIRQVLGTGTNPPSRDLCTGPMEQAQVHAPLLLPKSHSILLSVLGMMSPLLRS
jgi:hypothetical protein